MPSQIKAAARQQMAPHGTAGLSLRAIARELGITAPAIYNYGGAIGETLGVSLFAALWAAIVSIAFLRSRTLPRWVGIFGLIAALSLAINLVELSGIDLGGLITMTTTLVRL